MYRYPSNFYTGQHPYKSTSVQTILYTVQADNIVYRSTSAQADWTCQHLYRWTILYRLTIYMYYRPIILYISTSIQINIRTGEIVQINICTCTGNIVQVSTCTCNFVQVNTCTGSIEHVNICIGKQYCTGVQYIIDQKYCTC